MARIYILRPEESPIGVMVRAQIQEGEGVRALNEPLDIGAADGIINGVPLNTVAGFSIHILVPKGSVLCKRNRRSNTYFGLSRSSEKELSPDLEWWHALIEVRRTRDIAWMYTVWQDRQKDPRISNNVALWEAQENRVTMWEIGIVSPNGVDFYVAHDIRWDGKLYVLPLRKVGDFDEEERYGSRIVGVPADFKYGPFSVREDILDYGPFSNLLPAALPEFRGAKEEIEVPLDLPEPGYAIIDWWHMFMGQGQGQGVALLHDGTTAWVLGADIDPRAGGAQCLVRGTKLSYTDVGQDEQGRRTLVDPCLVTPQ